MTHKQRERLAEANRYHWIDPWVTTFGMHLIHLTLSLNGVSSRIATNLEKASLSV
jgi:hypothetical protein